MTGKEVVVNEDDSEVGVLEDPSTIIDRTSPESISAGSDYLERVYQESHEGVHQPERSVGLGKMLPPMVRETPRNIEQELSVTLPVSLPNTNHIRRYTCLYGTDKPNKVVDELLTLFTDEQKLSELVGADIPLIYRNGEWRMYLVPNDSLFFSVKSWLALNFPALISDEEVVTFEKTYDLPAYLDDDYEMIAEPNMIVPLED